MEFTTRAREERTPVWAVALGVLGLGALVVGAATAFSGWWIGSGFVALLVAMGNRMRRVRARADSAGLHVDRRLVVPRARLRDVWCDVGGDQWRVVVARDDGRLVVLEVPDEKAARALSDALPPHRATVAGYVWTRRDWWTWSLFVAAMLFASIFVARWIWTWLAAPIATLFAARRRKQVVAGADGIEIQSMAGTRFIAYTDVQWVGAEGVTLFGGEHIAWSAKDVASARGGATPWSERAFKRLLDDLDRRVADAKQRVPETNAQAAVAAAAASDAGYRGAALPDSSLWRVVESADAPPELRVRAAKELAVRDAGARARIADAANAVARSELRVELLAVAGVRIAVDGDVDATAQGELETEADAGASADAKEARRARRDP